MPTAVLLIAHGSRLKEANDDLLFVAEGMRAEGQYPIVETCFLELADPDIPTGGRRCVAAGADRVLMLPYFLSPGLHVTEDLQAVRDQLATAYPQAEWLLCDPIGRHPLLMQILYERLREASERTSQ
ncbi:MAG: CbiX/SirB N-terminal domain-containing protein [Planctomycetes bacterium]|nr:CbiX/SirB N-terminal domain-containing protein [Planctomycetota bacterium]